MGARFSIRGSIPSSTSSSWWRASADGIRSAIGRSRQRPDENRYNRRFMSLYLGLDSSTQSLTAVVLDVRGSDRSIAFQHALGFDRELPAYGTKHGVLPDADPRVALSSPLMWADALDRMMGIVATALGSDVRHVRAISGSAQQHGTVYLN